MSASVYVAPPDSLEEVQAQVPVTEVHLDGLAALKIVGHCDESLPTMVAGSLLGLDVNGILEVTYAFPIPTPRAEGESGQEGPQQDEVDSQEYQIEMMKMLRDVHVDNNCVGWYQSMYLGTFCTNDVVNSQYSYQSSEELSDNSIVILYDPIQSKKGALVIKAFRLTAQFVQLRKYKSNAFIKPSDILEEIPIKLTNCGHTSAFLRCLTDSHAPAFECDFEQLAVSCTDTYLERNLELVNSWMDDLVQEQQRFQMYSKGNSKTRVEHIRWLSKRLNENLERREAGEEELSTNLEDSGLKQLPEAPTRLEPLLMIGQLDRFSKQINEHVDNNIQKLYMTSQCYGLST
mmetsp:Transcript_20221/g.20327  ORF Transcript_20221/g.20327 Transcript_20221/m.20327 type:complete len:346 (+) Transcript_20221:51-1088(+)|eukprot:CAMPEP_0182416930 /NCGR_PEP_ID=MMETSP1167-20130531/1333_1 /TAXON_ID=2988 /ORGANISM="Mallomonas Sp, Strain CCMP3275" /LENGTH=345 /DNA_ID=CAMNT_0024590123 /DNA_START=26 /DNA_END=1063 /DNA_ORIENTATION=+